MLHDRARSRHQYFRIYVCRGESNVTHMKSYFCIFRVIDSMYYNTHEYQPIKFSFSHIYIKHRAVSFIHNLGYIL